MNKDYKEKLIDFAEDILKRGNGSEEQMRSWIFGAIQFASRANLIGCRTADELWKKYRNFN